MPERPMRPCCTTTSILLWEANQTKITLYAKTKWFTVATFCSNSRKFQILCVIPVRSKVVDRSFFCIRQNDNWFQNMLADLLSDYILVLIDVHGQSIFILKTDICNAYMVIHPHRKMTTSILIGSWFIRHLHVFVH